MAKPKFSILKIGVGLIIFVLGALLGTLAMARYCIHSMRISEASRLGRTVITLNHLRAGNTNRALTMLEYDLASSVILLTQGSSGNEPMVRDAIEHARNYLKEIPTDVNDDSVIEEVRRLLATNSLDELP